MNALFCSQKLSLFSTYLQKGSIKSFLCSLTTMGHFPFILIFIRVTFIDMGRRGQGRTVCSGLHSWDNSVYQKFRQCSYASHILCVDSSVRTFSNSIIWASINLWKQHSSRGLELLVPYKSEPTIWRSKLLNQFIETHYMCLGCLFSHAILRSCRTTRVYTWLRFGLLRSPWLVEWDDILVIIHPLFHASKLCLWSLEPSTTWTTPCSSCPADSREMRDSLIVLRHPSSSVVDPVRNAKMFNRSSLIVKLKSTRDDLSIYREFTKLA